MFELNKMPKHKLGDDDDSADDPIPVHQDIKKMKISNAVVDSAADDSTIFSYSSSRSGFTTGYNSVTDSPLDNEYEQLRRMNMLLGELHCMRVQRHQSNNNHHQQHQQQTMRDTLDGMQDQSSHFGRCNTHDRAVNDRKRKPQNDSPNKMEY